MSTHVSIAAGDRGLEPFVSADVAAHFLGIPRRFLLQLARQGLAGSYAIGGPQRYTWIFRLSELSSAIDPKQKWSF